MLKCNFKKIRIEKETKREQKGKKIFLYLDKYETVKGRRNLASQR
jgi:hypothetical protein